MVSKSYKIYSSQVC